MVKNLKGYLIIFFFENDRFYSRAQYEENYGFNWRDKEEKKSKENQRKKIETESNG